MDLVQSIASFSSLYSMAEAQMKAAVKVAKIAQSQDQVVADMVSAAMENVEELIEGFVSDLGNSIDTFA